MEMENFDKAIATVSGLQVGTYHFRLTVKDQQGLSSTTTLTVAVKKGESGQRAGGSAGGGGWGAFYSVSQILSHMVIWKCWCLFIGS